MFSGQALLKHVLGKGDEVVLVLMDSVHNQGVYTLVVNLGEVKKRGKGERGKGGRKKGLGGVGDSRIRR